MSTLVQIPVMGKCYIFLKTCFVCFLFYQTAYAQLLPFEGKIFGESIVTQFGSGGLSHFVATSTTVYQEESSGINLTYYNKRFTAPPGRTIKDMGPKRVLLQDFVLILLDNGDVVKIDSYNGNVISTSHIGESGTQTWLKIKGEAIYALSTLAFYVTRDDGITSYRDTTGLNGAQVRDFDLDSAFAMIFVATSNGLFVKDTLPGSTWSKLNSFTGTNNVRRVFLDRINRILVGGNGSGLWKSLDNGVTWIVDTVGLGPGGTLDLFADDRYGNLYGANTNTRKLYRSSNGNQPWQQIDAGINIIAGASPLITKIKGDSLVSISSNFGMFFSSDQGSTWIKSDSGIRAQNYFGLARLNNGNVFTSTNFGIYRNVPGDSTPTKSYPQIGFSGQVNVFADNADVLYGLDNSITHNNNSATPIVKSTNGGLTWTVDTTGLSAITGNLFYIDETGVQHYANTLFGSSFINNIWKRSPPGAWTLDVDGFSPTNNSFNSAMVSDGNGYLYISGSFGGKKLMRRPIAGGTWVVDTVGIGSAVNRFTMMTKGHNGNVIGSNGFVLKQRTGGSWNTIPIPASLSAYTISAIAVDSSGKLFVAFVDNSNVGKGVYYVTNYEANWTLVGLDSIWVTQMKAYNDTVYALSLGFGAYKLVAGVGPALPLKLLSFTAVNHLSTNLLTWKTENEYNTSHFEIERSATGTGFNSIGSVGSSNLAGVQNDYMFIDQHPLKGDNYYRLKMIDKDSKTSYSKIERVYLKPGTSISVYPNPSKDQFMIRGLSQDQPGSFKVFDLAGKLIIDKKGFGINQVIDLGHQPAGNYVLKINQGIEELYFLLIRN